MSPVRAESPDDRDGTTKPSLWCALPPKNLPISTVWKPVASLSARPTFRLRGIYSNKMTTEKREKLEGKLRCPNSFSSM